MFTSSRSRNNLRRWCWFFVRVLLVLPVLLLFVLYFSPKPLLVNRLSFSQAVQDENGQLLRLSLSSDDKYRLWVPISEMSPAFIESTLLYEDRHFYRHPGVNPYSLLRAALLTYLTQHPRTGGSTISMQLARMRFGIHSHNVPGKIEQIFRALQLERHYSKKALLEAYLNCAPYGENIEGAGAASLIYFSKSIHGIGLAEALALSVVPQNPSKRAPRRLSSEQPSANELLQARRQLFASWIKKHPEDEVRKVQLELPFEAKKRRALPFFAPHFVDEVIRQNPDKRIIQGSLDLNLQRLMERIISAYVEKRSAVGVNNASALLLDYHTMELKALAGSADYFNQSIQGQVDGTQGRRSPGSALKPFLYALGIDRGLIHPQSVLKDTPASFASYNPENFDKEFVGPINATDALVHSRNLPAIQLANRLPSPGFYGFLQRVGIEGLRSEDFYGLSLVLGGVEVSMREIAALYAMLANGGRLRALQLLKTHPFEAGTQVLSAEAAFLVLEMLRENPRPEQENDYLVQPRASKAAWKTGTSFGFRDAWAAGVVGQYVLVVWIGNFDGRANPVFIGREAAGPLFFNVVDGLRAQGYLRPEVSAASGLNIKKIKVCAVSGDLPGPSCKHLKSAWFIPGKSPISSCKLHREIMVLEQSGLRACDGIQEKTKQEIYEFWPSDLLKVFRASGIKRRVPPPHDPRCSLLTGQGTPPEITSPEKGIVYNVRLDTVGEERIPFHAVGDADVEHFFWFVNEKLVAKLPPSESFWWVAQTGRFIVRVVDDHGRADNRPLEVKVVE